MLMGDEGSDVNKTKFLRPKPELAGPRKG